MQILVLVFFQALACLDKLPAMLRIQLQTESCLFKLGMPRSWKWAEDLGDVAWRQHISRFFYPRNIVLTLDHSAEYCNFILSAASRLTHPVIVVITVGVVVIPVSH